jgi:hypothetical protein
MDWIHVAQDKYYCGGGGGGVVVIRVIKFRVPQRAEI